jgi:hypothetical protein
LKTDYSLYLSDVLLDHEEFVHEAEGEAVFFADKAARVAETLEQDKGLVRPPLLSDGRADKLNHEVQIEVGR